MVSRLQMIGQMSSQGRFVEADQDAVFSLAPQQNVRIGRAERQVWQVADAHHVQGADAGLIVPDHGTPEQAALVLVEYEAERHGQVPAACWAASRRRSSAVSGPRGAAARCRSI